MKIIFSKYNIIMKVNKFPRRQKLYFSVTSLFLFLFPTFRSITLHLLAHNRLKIEFRNKKRSELMQKALRSGTSTFQPYTLCASQRMPSHFVMYTHTASYFIVSLLVFFHSLSLHSQCVDLARIPATHSLILIIFVRSKFQTQYEYENRRSLSTVQSIDIELFSTKHSPRLPCFFMTVFVWFVCILCRIYICHYSFVYFISTKWKHQWQQSSVITGICVKLKSSESCKQHEWWQGNDDGDS